MTIPATVEKLPSNLSKKKDKGAENEKGKNDENPDR